MYSALLIVLDNGIKIPIGAAEECRILAVASLKPLMATLCELVTPFVQSSDKIDYGLLPVFALLLIYRAAKVSTEQLLVNVNLEEELRRLRVFRKFLKTAGQRWLAGSEYSMD